MTPRPDAATVAAMLAERASSLVPELIPDGRRQGRHWVARCPWRADRTPGSFMVDLTGQRAGRWQEWATGEQGDMLDLIAHVRGTAAADAWRWALAWLGIGDGALPPAPRPRPVAPPERPREAPRPATLDLAESVRRSAVAADAPGSVVPAYLASRGLALEPAAPLRFHPHAWRNREYGPHGPAMVADMSDPASGEWCGLHVTYLRPDGSGKAEGERPKIMLGRQGIVRLVGDAEVTMGLGLAEGIETALSVMQGFGWRPVWAATSAGMIRTFPVLPGIEALTIFADADGPGMEAARICAARWTQAGREVRITSPPAGDFNDLLQERAA